MRPYWIRLNPNLTTGVPMRGGKFGHRDTEGRPCDDRSTDCSDAAARTAGHHRKPEEVGWRLQEHPLRGVALPAP